MTPHPLATWVQMTVSPQREAIRRRKRRRAAHLRHHVRSLATPVDDGAETTTPRVPLQRRALEQPAVHL